MTTRDVGDRQNVEHRVYDPYTGALTNATVVLTVTAPDATTSTPTVSNPSTGVYRASFTLSQAGKWYWKWDVSGTIIDISTDEITALDPAPPPYLSLGVFKESRNINGTVVDRDDALLRALLTASRRIDRRCNRRFYLDKTATARIYFIKDRVFCDEDGEWLMVDDIGSTTGLVVEIGSGTTWTTITDYETGPANALARREPITKLLRPYGYWYTGWRTRARITARWGWPVIPEEVASGTGILANRYYMRKDSPHGVVGTTDWGDIRVSRLDPDVEDLIGSLEIPSI